MIMKQPALLYRLQKIDLALKAGAARLDEIEAALRSNKAIQDAESAVQKAKDFLTPWQTRTADLDLEINGITEKAKSTEEKLYSGSISNTKELQDMQDEIASLKRRRAKLEDRMLEAMIEVEGAEEKLARAERALKDVRVQVAEENQALVEEQAELEEKRARLKHQRQEVIDEIAPENLKTYRHLMPRRHGHPVAVIDSGGVCTSCGIRLTQSVLEQVRDGGELTLCTNCGRILAFE